MDNEMIYALNIAEDGRILSATFPQYAGENSVFVVGLPEGDITDYYYRESIEEGEVVGYYYDYEPIVVEPIPEEPTQLDRIEAQVLYTALLTDTILEEVEEDVPETTEIL